MDYIDFRKDWKEAVTLSHDELFLLQEIQKAVHSHAQPDIKNLNRMGEVWEVFDEESGQVMENLSGLVNCITSFLFPRDPKTGDQKFTEMTKMRGQVYTDLEELEKTDILNH